MIGAILGLLVIIGFGYALLVMLGVLAVGGASIYAVVKDNEKEKDSNENNYNNYYDNDYDDNMLDDSKYDFDE